MTKETAELNPDGKYNKDNFMNNELVIARAGTLEYLEGYFDKAANNFDNVLGNVFSFSGINFEKSQGTIIWIGSESNGVLENDLESSGYFVGVLPKS